MTNKKHISISSVFAVLFLFVHGLKADEHCLISEMGVVENASIRHIAALAPHMKQAVNRQRLVVVNPS